MAVNEWLGREVGHAFYTASLEKKADFSREMRPLVLEAMGEGDVSLDPLSIALAAHEYGLPWPDDLTQAAAIALARAAVTDTFGIPADARFSPLASSLVSVWLPAEKGITCYALMPMTMRHPRPHAQNDTSRCRGRPSCGCLRLPAP